MAMDPDQAGIGETTTQPTDVVIETAVIISAVLAGAAGAAGKSAVEAGVKGSQALIEYLRKEGPMAHRVLASWKEGKSPCLALEFINVTLHGGYVETIEVVKPSANFDFDLAFTKRKDASIGWGNSAREDDSGARKPVVWKKQTELLPLYVPPAGTATLLLGLKDDVAGTLAKTSLVTLSYQFSIVGGDLADTDPSKKPKEIRARLRTQGPFYLD
ncbi:MAG: hypothetical protein KIS79_11265 [Burkholderiales bacterium]|nr:hypothetical protein [Burkholderiales bacterium]